MVCSFGTTGNDDAHEIVGSEGDIAKASRVVKRKLKDYGGAL